MLGRLDAGLLIDADEERVLGPREVEADDVGGLGGELGVGAQAPVAAPLQVDAVPAQDPPDVLLGDVAERLREQPRSPHPTCFRQNNWTFRPLTPVAPITTLRTCF